ncbi:MAG TPA: DUF4846 domain-containing protein [Chitinophagaceae bacterium]|nr:DUF4846 domain-containing protein [Chitinophagaceae bacterium]
MNYSTLFAVYLLAISCKINDHEISDRREKFSQAPIPGRIKDIPLPEGYERIAPDENSFGEWMRGIRLKKDNHVYLYNGSLKKNQVAQFAVLDITVGKKDLQQCADAVMRLRAEYLFDEERYDEIVFKDNNSKSYAWNEGSNKKNFTNYLERVFACCGTASLEKQLKPVDLQSMQPGCVFIKGGFPGHAMLVADMAVNKKGMKIFLLAQSYMPAQDIHVVKNPLHEKLSPWYELDGINEIVTPEWTFYTNQLRKF